MARDDETLPYITHKDYVYDLPATGPMPLEPAFVNPVELKKAGRYEEALYATRMLEFVWAWGDVTDMPEMIAVRLVDRELGIKAKHSAKLVTSELMERYFEQMVKAEGERDAGELDAEHFAAMRLRYLALAAAHDRLVKGLP